MASNPYIKSLIWLVSLGGIGYVLLRVSQPSEEKLKIIRQSISPEQLSEEKKKNQALMKRLQEATTEDPIYLKPKKNN